MQTVVYLEVRRSLKAYRSYLVSITVTGAAPQVTAIKRLIGKKRLFRFIETRTEFGRTNSSIFSFS